MNFKNILAAACLLLGATAANAADFINLTPAPKQMSVTDGEYTLPAGMKISATGLSENMAAEVAAFVGDLNTATGLKASIVTEGSADVTITVNSALAAEGYNLNVTADGVSIEAATPAGLFYAFQTFKKLLPANVMAVVAETKTYALPLVNINDEPRLKYRGFMLDVSRHFFTVDEVKRMLDVMAFYKLNKFHWHLTDDQGWRIEIPTWPRLTSVGATSPNCRFTDYKAKSEYWINRSYGPYFYTVKEMKDVVDYAKKLHIDIIPEVEMPGHFSAVNTAYPELSCRPDGAHSVARTGGIYSDIMNVASPYTEQFYKDVIDLLAEVFPYELIHIGGDECPTSAWQSNEDCKAKVEELGLKGNNEDQKFRKLQSWFTKNVADYAATKGKKIACWNETINAAGTDLDLIKKTGVTIYCWTGPDNAVNVATNNGLPAIYTPYSSTAADKGAFYINRKQDPDDPPANGNTWDTVDKVYNTTPFTTGALNSHPDLCFGVQGTFWAERVSDREYLEWLALPRLLAIAEVGLTPHNRKDWSSFQKRMSADRELLDLRGYKYSHHKMLDYEAPDWTKPAGPYPAMELPAEGTYIIENAENGLYFSDDNTTSTLLGNTASAWDNNIWQLSAPSVNEDNSVSLTLTNRATGRTISGADAYNDPAARAVRVGNTSANVAIASMGDGTVKFTVNGFTCWPIEETSVVNPSTITSGNNINAEHDASEMQPIRWKLIPVTPVTFVCSDTEGKELFSGVRGVPADVDVESVAPEIKNFTLKSTEKTDDETVKCVYERTGVTVTTRVRLENGALLAMPTEQTVAPGENVTVKTPEVAKYFTYKETIASDADAGTGSFTATTDVNVDIIYATEALIGVKEPAGAVSNPVEGMAYLIHDDHVDRNAYRYGNASKKVAGTWTCYDRDPYFVWTLESKGEGFAIKNLGWDLYVQAVTNNNRGTLAKTAKEFQLVPFGKAWTIKNAANNQVWDGQENLNMVGWTAPGHPHTFYEFIAEPYFRITITKVDTEGEKIGTDTSVIVKAGSPYTVEIPEVKKYEYVEMSGHDDGATVEENKTVTITYKSTESAIAEIETAPESDEIYDLQGRRLDSPRTGINIINRTKTLRH